MREKLSLPMGWEIKKLGEVCEIKGRIGYRGYTVNDLVEKGEGAITLSPSNIQNNQFNTEKCTYISWFKYEESPEIMVFEGDILFVKTGSTYGKVALVERLPEKATINPQFVVLKNIKCSNRFLYYALTTSDFKEKVENIIGGAATPTLSQTNLAEQTIPLPPLPEQQRIVSILDEAFAAIAKAKANAEQNLKNAKELFESYLQGVFENGNWETKTIELVCDEIFAGGDAPKNNFSLEPNEKHTIPIYANAVKDRGLYGYTDFARVTKPCVTIAARGSGTGHTELRNEHFLPIVRLIVCIPDTKQISTEFLKYTIDNLVIQRSGSAIPQLTVPMIKDYKIPVPSIEEQKQIIEKAETLKQQKENLENVYLKKIEGLEELKKSILQKTFAGELRGGEPVELKTKKSRRDDKIIENKINQTKPNPEGVI